MNISKIYRTKPQTRPLMGKTKALKKRWYRRKQRLMASICAHLSAPPDAFGEVILTSSLFFFLSGVTCERLLTFFWGDKYKLRLWDLRHFKGQTISLLPSNLCFIIILSFKLFILPELTAEWSTVGDWHFGAGLSGTIQLSIYSPRPPL